MLSSHTPPGPAGHIPRPASGCSLPSHRGHHTVTSAGRRSWSSILPVWSCRCQTSGSSGCSHPTAAEAGPAALGAAVVLPADPGASGCTRRRAAWGVPSKNGNGRKMSQLPPRTPHKLGLAPLGRSPHPLATHWNHLTEPWPHSKPMKPKRSARRPQTSALF